MAGDLFRPHADNHLVDKAFDQDLPVRIFARHGIIRQPVADERLASCLSRAPIARFIGSAG